MNSKLGEKWPGLDIRADGGYSCILGRTNHGEYVWLRDREPFELDILPDALRLYLGLLQRPSTPNRSAKEKMHATGNRMAMNGRVDSDLLIRRALDRASNDGRNNAGFWLATQLRDNGYAKRDAKDNVYPRKVRSENKIDGAVALLMALNRDMVSTAGEPSVYETRGILSI